jgi:hypothetical protein
LGVGKSRTAVRIVVAEAPFRERPRRTRANGKGPAPAIKWFRPSGTFDDRAGLWRASALRWPAILHAVAVAGDRDDMSVVDETVQSRGSENRINEHFGPELKGLVGRYDDRSALIAF